MGVACASCGQVIPSGQLRCGHCGAAAPREDLDDYGGLLEVASCATDPGARQAAVSAQGSPPTPRANGDEDDANAREPLVPRGTFASEMPDRSAQGDEREVVKADGAKLESAKAAEPAKSADASQKVAVRSAHSSQRLKAVRAAERPPYLASEILREDLAPSEPGQKLLALVVVVAPLLGIVGALISGAQKSATWVAVAGLASVLSLGRFAIAYNTRALLVTLTGGGTLLLLSLWSVQLGASYETPLLASAATLLPAALLFRCWFRGSEAARVLVACTLVLALTWATATSDRQLLSLVFSWQSWLPALTWYVFGILCLLSLLAFMGDETTGGCDVWALGLSIWYGVYAWVRFALVQEAAGENTNLSTLLLVQPALAAPTSVALAQLLARALGSRPRREHRLSRAHE